MIIAGLDLETSGLDPHSDVITELGLVLWDTDKNFPVRIISSYVFDDKITPDISPEVTELTGIDRPILMEWGTSFEKMMDAAISTFSCSDAILTHNGINFDMLFMHQEAKRQSKSIPDKIVIDSLYDIPFPAKFGTRKLDFLAGCHGFLNPFPHRALFDVLSMLKIASNYSWQSMMESAKYPVIKIKANVTFNNNTLAKKMGYYWEPAPTKMWLKEIRANLFEQEKKEAPFEVSKL